MKRSTFLLAIAVLLTATTPSKTESTLGLDVTSASKDGLAMGVSATFPLENSFIQTLRIAGGGLYVRNLGPKNDKYKGYYIDTGIYGELFPTFHWQLNYTYIGGKLDKLDKGYYKSVETLSFIYRALDLVDVVAGINTESSYFVSLSKNIFENSSIFAGWSYNYDTEENKGFVGISIALQSTTKTSTKTTKTTKAPQKVAKIPHIGNPISGINVIAHLHNKITKEVVKPHYQEYNKEEPKPSQNQSSTQSQLSSSQSSFYSSSSRESSSSEAQSSSSTSEISYETQSSSEYYVYEETQSSSSSGEPLPGRP